MQIFTQMKPTKGSVNWDLVNVEGRTKKACQNTWSKFMTHHKQQMEAAGEAGGEATHPKPKAKAGRCPPSSPRSAK